MSHHPSAPQNAPHHPPLPARSVQFRQTPFWARSAKPAPPGGSLWAAATGSTTRQLPAREALSSDHPQGSNRDSPAALAAPSPVMAPEQRTHSRAVGATSCLGSVQSFSSFDVIDPNDSSLRMSAHAAGLMSPSQMGAPDAAAASPRTVAPQKRRLHSRAASSASSAVVVDGVVMAPRSHAAGTEFGSSADMVSMPPPTPPRSYVTKSPDDCGDSPMFPARGQRLQIGRSLADDDSVTPTKHAAAPTQGVVQPFGAHSVTVVRPNVPVVGGFAQSHSLEGDRTAAAIAVPWDPVAAPILGAFKSVLRSVRDAVTSLEGANEDDDDDDRRPALRDVAFTGFAAPEVSPSAYMMSHNAHAV